MAAEAPTLLFLRVPQFEAAVLQALHPSLRGRPVLAVSSFRALGRVLAASPEALACGVTAGMTVRLARERCPDAQLLPPDAEGEERAMAAIFAAATTRSPLVERAGRGGLLLDTAGTERLFGRGVDLAAGLQREVKDRYRLPTAMGLSRRRAWSALAQRVAEPEGVFAVLPGLEAGFLDAVSPAWLDGIGPRTLERLHEMNITNLGQLRPFGRERLVGLFGAAGRILSDVLAGEEDMLPVRPAEESLRCRDVGERIEAAATLAEDTVAAEQLRVVMRALAGTVAASLRMRGAGAARLRLRIAYADGRSAVRQARLPGQVCNEAVLRAAALRLLERLHGRRVRLTRLVLRAESLGPPERQRSLFEAPAVRTDDALGRSLDRIRRRYGAETLRSGAELLCRASDPDRAALGGGGR